MKIVFNDKNKTEKEYPLKFEGNIVNIETTDTPILDGFITYGLYDLPLTDGSKYTTLYRRLDNSYQLSNDGSVYVPPAPPTPPRPSRLDILEQRVDELTPTVLSQKAYIGDTSAIFENVYGSQITAFCVLESGLNISAEIEQKDDSVIVSFEALKEVATVTISIL